MSKELTQVSKILLYHLIFAGYIEWLKKVNWKTIGIKSSHFYDNEKHINTERQRDKEKDSL